MLRRISEQQGCTETASTKVCEIRSWGNVIPRAATNETSLV